MRLPFVFSIMALIGSYLAEFHLGIQPCRLCLYQRYIWLGIFITLAFAIRYRSLSIVIRMGATLGILVSTYHLGVIQNFFLDRCHYAKPKTIQEWRAMTAKGPQVMCSNKEWAPFNVPAPAWNVLLLLPIAYPKIKSFKIFLKN